jgi:hypothetical protein
MSAITKFSQKGITAQEKRANKKVITGEKKNIKVLEEKGIIDSLDNNLTPSAIGCNNPQKPTTLGPLLLCIEAKSFLSNKVKKATASITGKTKGKDLII